MNKIDEKKINALIHSIGLKHNLRDVEVKQMVESQFRFMFEQMNTVDLDTIEDDKIEDLKTNFFLKYIGKIHTSPERIRAIIKRKNKHTLIYGKDNK